MGEVNTDNINRSYLVGFNDELGWDVRHYFTFFGEFQRTNNVLPYVETTIIGLIFVISLTENIIVFLILCSDKRRRVTNNYFIANLALASILCVITAPLTAATRITETWIFGAELCSLMMYTQYCGAIIIVWTMAIMSIDRHHRSVRRSPLSPKFIVVVLFSLWVFATLVSIPLAVYFVVRDFPLGAGTVVICTLVWPNVDKVRVSVVFAVPSVLLLFVLPLLLILINYVQVMRALNESVRRFKSARFSAWTSQAAAPPRGRAVSSLGEIRVVRFLILLVVLFCVFWLPISVSFLLILYDGLSNALVMTSQLYIASVGLAMTNACVSPVIYTFVNERYRRCLRKLLPKKVKRTNAVRPLPVFVVDGPKENGNSGGLDGSRPLTPRNAAPNPY